MRAVVIGGGIGGLAAALALHRRGWEVQVLERAPSFAEVGAGLSLWPNALRALDELGLGSAVRGHAVSQNSGGIRCARGSWLSRSDGSALRARYGELVMVHRADLLKVFLRALPVEALRPGTPVERVSPDGRVVHAGGVTEGDLVVAADGLHSAVRRGLFPDVDPRYAGYTAWRFVTPYPLEVSLRFETWGRGRRFGCARLPDGRVYCFAVDSRPAGPDGDGIEAVRALFAGWHDPIPSLLESVTEEQLIRHDVYELPGLPSYVEARIALLGDAAHAMTPNLGQGACQALEDAVVLAECADRGDLAAYDAARRRHASMVSRRSANLGRVAQWSWPPAVALRNLALRLTPEAATLRSLEPVIGAG